MTAIPVRFEKIVKRFGAVTAVEEVDLEVPAGRLIPLLGPSGCGKTTLLRMVAGLERPSAGRIFFGDEDVTDVPPYRRDVTMMFQSYALFPHLDVFENIAYGLRVERRPAPEIRERIAAVARQVGLAGLEGRAVSALSGGQQQRVALARALVLKPRVLLFDEPLSNLDARLRKRVRGEIRDLQQELGITALYVTHDQEEAMALSDLVVVMNRGRIEQQGTPRALYTEPASRFVAEFIGEANFLDGEWDGAHVRVAGYRFAHRQDVAPGAVTVMVRPEAVEVSAPTGGDGLPGVVHAVAYLGARTEISVDSALGRLEGLTAGDAAGSPPPGTAVRVRFAPHGVHLLRRE